MKFDLVTIYETYDNLKGMWKASKEKMLITSPAISVKNIEAG